MKRVATSLLALTLGAFGCQKSDSPVQPEKLASSSPTSSSSTSAAPLAGASGTASATRATADASTSATASSSASGPLVPYAKKEEPAAEADAGIPSPDGPEPPKKKRKKRRRTKKRPPRASGEAAAKPSPKAAPRDEGRVELVKAGAAPLEKRRFTPAVGQVDKLDMTMTMAIGMKMGGKTVPKNSLPPMVMGMDTKVVEVKADGTIRYEFVLSKTAVKAPPKTDPRVLKPIEQSLGRLKGLNGHAVVTDQGITKEAKINLPRGLDQQTKQVMQGMEQAMNQISAPLPAEPIGVGAQWKYHSKLNQNGIILGQVATYDLVKIEGKVLHCNVSVAQTASPQRIRAPGGVTVDLLSLSSQGKGDTAIRLQHLAPTRSHIKLNSIVQMGGPKGQKMQVDTDMTIDIASP